MFRFEMNSVLRDKVTGFTGWFWLEVNMPLVALTTACARSRSTMRGR